MVLGGEILNVRVPHDDDVRHGLVAGQEVGLIFGEVVDIRLVLHIVLEVGMLRFIARQSLLEGRLVLAARAPPDEHFVRIGLLAADKAECRHKHDHRQQKQ